MSASSSGYIILIKTPRGEYEIWSDLKKYCMERGFTYCSLAKKKLPTVTKDGNTIHRIKV